jgi:hypothetical protein
MNLKDLKVIVQDALNATLMDGQVVDKRTLAHEVVTANKGAGDSDFALACSYQAIQVIAGDLIRQVSKEEVEDVTQGILPGFKYVRSHYSIVREKSPVVVPILYMTHEELLLKVVELRAHGYGALMHASELEKYATGIGAIAVPS